MTGYSYYNDVTDNSINKIQTEIMCPPQKEIAIYIHGAWTDETSVEEQLNRTAMSLAINNYTIPLIGFSWDSNTPFNEDGWRTAKIIGERNGPKLAQFILDFKNRCKDTDTRLIAHSLGAAVVNSTLVSLNNNQEWNNNRV
jgi:esterase/lipase superfamily enzyme